MMTAQEKIEKYKVYSEELKEWVIPVDRAQEILLNNDAQEFEENLGKLQESLKELDTLFGTLNNPSKLDD